MVSALITNVFDFFDADAWGNQFAILLICAVAASVWWGGSWICERLTGKKDNQVAGGIGVAVVLLLGGGIFFTSCDGQSAKEQEVVAYTELVQASKQFSDIASSIGIGIQGSDAQASQLRAMWHEMAGDADVLISKYEIIHTQLDDFSSAQLKEFASQLSNSASSGDQALISILDLPANSDSVGQREAFRRAAENMNQSQRKYGAVLLDLASK